MQGEPLERARSTREGLTVERSPISDQSWHLRPLCIDDTEVREKVY